MLFYLVMAAMSVGLLMGVGLWWATREETEEELDEEVSSKSKSS